MKSRATKTGLLAALPLTLVLAPTVDELQHKHTEGQELRRSFEVVTKLTLDEMRAAVNGEEVDPAMMGEQEMDTETRYTLAVLDEIQAVSDGSPTRLARTYEEIAVKSTTFQSNSMVGDMDTEQDGTSELEGLKVTFDQREGEWVPSFPEDVHGDDELLEGLIADLSLADFLPEGEVAEGDAWELDPQLMIHLIVPGGDLKIELEELEEAGMGMSNSTPSPTEAWGEIDGDLSAEYGGVREEDGRRLAVIRITFDVYSAKDMSEMLEEVLAEVEGPNGMDMDIDLHSADAENEYEGSGELLWDMAAGRLAGVRLSGDLGSTIDMVMSMEVQNQSMELEQTLVLSGTQKIEASVE